MPIATLKFKLPEEKDEYTLAISGLSLWSVLWSIKEELRSKRKYNTYETAEEALEDIEDILNKEMEDNQITFNLVD